MTPGIQPRQEAPHAVAGAARMLTNVRSLSAVDITPPKAMLAL
jgi:hypothetical protein